MKIKLTIRCIFWIEVIRKPLQILKRIVFIKVLNCHELIVVFINTIIYLSDTNTNYLWKMYFFKCYNPFVERQSFETKYIKETISLKRNPYFINLRFTASPLKLNKLRSKRILKGISKWYIQWDSFEYN